MGLFFLVFFAVDDVWRHRVQDVDCGLDTIHNGRARSIRNGKKRTALQEEGQKQDKQSHGEQAV